jgi:flagellar basal-body rod protein FlgB
MPDIQQYLSVFSEAMNYRVQRHQVLASNIANADTPNYKARDFDFQKAMHSAMQGRSQGSLALAATSSGHLQGSSSTGASLQYRQETQSAVDGNTVDMDVERSQISENAIQYQVLTQLVGDRFKSLRSALANTNS